MIIYTENIIRNHRKKLIAAALVLVMTVAGGIVFNSLHAEKNEDTGVKLKSISQPVYLCSDDMAEYYKGKFTLDEVKRAEPTRLISQNQKSRSITCFRIITTATL